MVLLAGGTGGAKLAQGMLDEVGEQLVVIANTGDDVEVSEGDRTIGVGTHERRVVGGA